ncbi:MAG: hypothetical protein QOD56_2585 [Gammaproteobacteria bacterium]|nr:hypothetical protein [Gammaproteobacteria bacterium]
MRKVFKKALSGALVGLRVAVDESGGNVYKVGLSRLPSDADVSTRRA